MEIRECKLRYASKYAHEAACAVRTTTVSQRGEYKNSFRDTAMPHACGQREKNNTWRFGNRYNEAALRKTNTQGNTCTVVCPTSPIQAVKPLSKRQIEAIL